MGQAISRIAVDYNCEITAPVDQGDDAAEKINDCDVIIDFSLADATLPMAEIAANSGKPMVIGTTGHHKDLKQKIEDILDFLID